jgi:hypothetical protein
MEAADEEVAHETIEEARVAAQENTKAVAETFALLVSDECQVGRYVNYWSGHLFHLRCAAIN